MNTPLTLLSLLCLFVLTGCGALRPADGGGGYGRNSRPPRGPRPDPTSAIRTDIVTHAQELLGVSYKFGGNTPREGFDCSGFTRYLYQYAGLDLNRVSRDQARQGKLVRAEAARPGDLVFFRRPGKPVFHVSLVVAAGPGELWVIHSTSSRGVIRENILASSYWRSKIYQVRDVLG